MLLTLRDQIQCAISEETSTPVASQRDANKSIARVEAYQHVLTLLDKQPDLGKTFFYLLLRDHLPAGTVEGLVSEVEAQGERVPAYSNEFLAGYAAELSARIAR